MPKNVVDDLTQVYTSSKTLVENIIDKHQQVTDCLCALRFLMNLTPEAKIFVAAIGEVIEYQENLYRITASYHKAVGSVVRVPCKDEV
jgi:hypothetical protein